MAFDTFEDFWPYYLGEHRDPVCRGLHYVGSTLGLAWLGAAVVTANPLFVLPGLVNGYAFAWIWHFFFEKNRPATFQHPFYSFAGDWKMYWYFLTGRIGRELAKLEKAGAEAESPAAA